MAYNNKSTQITSVDSDDNTYISEADLLGRVRGVAFTFTAAGTVSIGDTVELARVKATRAVGVGAITNTARASATLKIGHGSTDVSGTGAVTDDDSFSGGSTVSLASGALGVKDLKLHDGTAEVAYLDLPANEFSLVATVGGAALSAGDSITGVVYVIQ
jgi:hypothetical protein